MFRQMRTNLVSAAALKGAIVGMVIFSIIASGLQTVAAADWNCANQKEHKLERTKPFNLGQLKNQLKDYKYCGGYDRELEATLARAIAYVQVRARKISNAAIVLDIDETSLSNWPQIEQDDFGYFSGGECTLKPHEPCGADRWTLDHTAKAIEPTRKLFETAKRHKVAVFFITGRPDKLDFRIATEKNLKDEHYDSWADLIMRPTDSNGSVAIFKTAARKSIFAQGYKIIANIGDQQSDLEGGYAEQTFKVPNPFYFIP